MKAFIFYLIGFSGTGKLTIAQALQKRIDAVIIDNQLINQPVFVAVRADGMTPLHPGVWREIRKIREATFNAICYLADKETSFILTNELFEGTSDARIYDEVEAVAETRNSIFVPVRLICEQNELLKRVTHAEREMKLKMRSAEMLQHKFDTLCLLKPSHSNLLELDVTHLQPMQAADMIFTHAKQLAEKAI